MTIQTWQERLGIPNTCRAHTGEEAAMCGEIADLRKQAVDLLALRDQVALLMDINRYRTMGDVMALEAAYEKVK